MRFTIERIRTLVLAAALLLLAALGMFLWRGKWKNPFSRKDMPQKLGLNIQQEANGFTFVHAFGAHSQYRIHASKEIQLKSDRIELHQVEIDLFGPDGRRMDHIEGDEFEYDQKSGLATAQGPVDMELTRPATAPTESVKNMDQLAAVAESGGSGQVHVKTSGITFDRNSGMVTTDQKVNFSMAQGSGSATGARYDAQKGYMTLERAVQITTHRGNDSVEIRADHAEFDRDALQCQLRMATAAYRGGQANAAQAKILFRKDGSASRLEAAGGFTLSTTAGGRLSAPVGAMDFDEHNQPRHGHLEGGVTMDSTGPDRKAHGTAPVADLEFVARGQLRRAHLERGVAFDSEEHSGHAAQSVRRTWRSPVADIDFRDVGGGRVEAAAIRGRSGVTITSETRRGNGPLVPSKMSADEVTGVFAPGSVLRSMTGSGHAGIEQTTANGTRQTAAGDRLLAQFATAQHGKNGGMEAAEVEQAVLEGHASLYEQTAAKKGKTPAPLRVSAGKVTYEGAGEWAHLTGSPRIVNGSLEMTAETVDVSRISGEAFAHGNVKATWTAEHAAQGKQNASSGGLTFGSSGPLHAIAAEVQINQNTSEATFRGKARLWQQTNSISGPVIVLNKDAQTLAAHATNSADPVRVVLLNAGAPAAGSRGGPSSPSVIRVRGGELFYSDAERRALMRGDALGTVIAETGTATSASDAVELLLAPAGGRGNDSSALAQVDRMTSTGHVTLTSQGRRGTGEKLVYTGSTGDYVLTGTAAVQPKMTDPRRGSVAGEALIFHSRDDSVSIEGGRGGTRTETSAPRQRGK